ncbi:DUF6261 family protein [Draconibacterium sp. IB214405]|uniref:DUF6261 family protein n=1 Tax=Draconibacterium sp. IB214405 TaxID=3097352 RepID=UPI002A1632C7|nr:DUF6261 family protein [Draconibacterium sp. IB214405]MDX8338860.1 DUF6261 family protein [Draconibacterium sp. IB214405]
MIQKLIAQSRVTEVDAVSMRLIGAYNSTTLSSDPHLSTMFTELTGLSAALTAAINRSKAESTLEEYDEARDQPFRSLSYLLMGYLHHPDAAIQEAAETVYDIFEKYGLSVVSESYATESSLIASLLDDLSKPKLQDAIAVLPGCADTVAALQTAEATFEAARIAYEQEKAEESTQVNASKIKEKVVALINEKIVIYMRAMELVDEPNYGALARTIATIIAENNEVVKKRRKTPEEETVSS